MHIRPIERTDAKGGFSCGKPALDAFFARHAWDHHRKDVARVYVLEDATAHGTILGFYTLAARELARERLHGPLPGSYPKYPLPVFYIGHFAVVQQRQGLGIGRMLMGDALQRCLEGRQVVGAVGVFLDSLDDDSTRFYAALGFVPIPRHGSAEADSPQPMFLAMKALVAAAPAGEGASRP